MTLRKGFARNKGLNRQVREKSSGEIEIQAKKALKRRRSSDEEEDEGDEEVDTAELEKIDPLLAAEDREIKRLEKLLGIAKNSKFSSSLCY